VDRDLAGAALELVQHLERSLVASANGAPGAPDGIFTFSSTKYSPVGVGVELLPTTAA
jgi:hypothetical protein